MKPLKRLENDAPERSQIEAFRGITHVDFMQLVLGNPVRRGMTRSVFECRLDPSLVVKVEDNPWRGQNVAEWEIWNAARSLPAISKWLAPCVYLSAYGAVLFQKRTSILGERQIPKKLPAFLEYERGSLNFGLLDGKPVCHDYAMTLGKIMEAMCPTLPKT